MKMKFCVVSIRDQKANAFAQPAMTPTVGIALRSFADQVNGNHEGNSTLRDHPEDFALWHIANWDDSTAQYEIIEPKQLCVASDLVTRN